MQLRRPQFLGGVFFITFMVLAILLAAIAIVTDSVILVIGAMVLGPEFVPIAALGLAPTRFVPSAAAAISTK